MLSQKTFIILFLILCTLGTQVAFGQEIKLIDNKGTFKKINNNNLTSATTPPPTAYKGDIWINTNSTPSTIHIYDGASWVNSTHTGTPGSILFTDASGSLTEENSQLFWDTSNNRLGIGTNSPTNKFHVTGAIRSEGVLNSEGTEETPSYRFKIDTNTGMYRPAADEIGFTVGGYEALHIDEITTGNTIVSIKQTLKLDGKIEDETNSTGSPGQILSSTATGTAWISTILTTVETKTSNYTLTLTDNGKIIEVNSAAVTTITIPAGLPSGYRVSITQLGTGQVTFSGTGGIGAANVKNVYGYHQTAAQYAKATIEITSTGIAIISGDLL